MIRNMCVFNTALNAAKIFASLTVNSFSMSASDEDKPVDSTLNVHHAEIHYNKLDEFTDSSAVNKPRVNGHLSNPK